MKRRLVFTLVAMMALSAFASTGWYQDYVLVSSNGAADTYNWIGSDPGYGSPYVGATFHIVYGQTLEVGADMRYWSDNQDRTGGAFYWKIDSGAFNEVLWAQNYLGGNDYQGLEATENNVAAGLDAGTYTVSVYAKSWGSSQGDSYLSNEGANYVATLVVAKATASVYLGSLSQTYDGTAKAASATTMPAGLTVTFTYDGSATAPTAAGSYAVTGTVNSANYQGSAAGTLVIAKASQTIDFPAIGNQLTTNEVELSATASSSLGVDFAVASGPASIEGTTLTFSGAGTVSIVASQDGNSNWNAAPDVTNTFDVTEPDLAVVLSQTNVNVREAGEGRFFVRLNKNPGAEVMVNVSRSAGDASLVVQDGSARSFKSSNWSAWQTVTLAQADDGDADAETATFQVSLSGAADQFVGATALDDDVTNNLALATGGSEISASYAYSRPEQLIDGVHTVNTNYGYTVCTSVPPGTITLDLKATATVSRVRVLTWDWVRLDHRYTIESSPDGSNWSPLIDATAEEHHGWDEWVLDDETFRYLRFTGESSTQAKDALSVSELEVYGTRDLSGLPQAQILDTAVNVREAGEGRFFVRLDKAPESLVTVSVAYSSGDSGISVQSGATRTFKPSNWSTWQAVTLVAAGDADGDGETTTFRVSVPGRADQFVTATALDDEIGNNVALASGGSTIIGSRSSRVAELIDGIHNSSTNYGYTIWTNIPAGRITLDMKQSMLVSRIRLLNWDWVYRAHRYTIESSEDGSNWSTLIDASAEDHVGWDDWEVEDSSARYLRFTGLTNTANQCVVVPELEVYGVPGPLPAVELSSDSVNVREAGEGRFFVRLANAPTGNVAVTVARSAGDSSLTVQQGATRSFTTLNWSQWQVVTLAQVDDVDADGETATFQISAPGYEDAFVSATALDDDIAENVALASGGATITAWKAYRPSHLIDGIHASSVNYGYTTWTNDPEGTITLDMGASMTVSRIRLLNWDWVYRTHRYQVESSTDGENWSVVANAGAENHQGWDDWAVASQAIRYLRFTGISNSANAYVCISELEVYGTRPPVRRSLAAKGASSIVESEPVTVMTSDDVAPVYESGWAAVDGDPETAWTGQQAGGGYILVEYGPTLELSALEVDLAEGSLADIQFLYSLDAQDWQPLPDDMESNPVSLNFLWLVFPDDGTDAVPQVIEIRPNP